MLKYNKFWFANFFICIWWTLRNVKQVARIKKYNREEKRKNFVAVHSIDEYLGDVELVDGIIFCDEQLQVSIGWPLSI